MTLAPVESLARKAGLCILKTESMRWGLIPDTDRLTFLERPAL
jgi:hypothetical protein